MDTDDATVMALVAEEYGALADLLEGAENAVWDEPSLCEGWRTREVVAHVTMPARYDGPAFMAELEAAAGDFTALSNTVAARDGALGTAALVAGLRSPILHEWQPPGGGVTAALTHCVIHQLDITEAVPLARRVPDECIAAGPRHRDCARRAQPLRRRPVRRHPARQRSRLVRGFGCHGERAGSGARPRGLRAPSAGGPPRRRSGEPLQPRLTDPRPSPRRNGCTSWCAIRRAGR